ncbi:hypothetical protein CHS0354_000787 [Potamilus streckersoni]|uniref:coproporphyrinogen oxidase n=1 Tax=Potamilus streckersoni TaxID=2493646 RepID=A0AAE0T877_9BIVA|nr:hypothetical protein CHS0354_000787 [Potamilus streckersoni]
MVVSKELIADLVEMQKKVLEKIDILQNEGTIPKEIEILDFQIRELESKLEKNTHLIKRRNAHLKNVELEITAIREKIEKHKEQQNEVKSNKDFDLLSAQIENERRSEAEKEKERMDVVLEIMRLENTIQSEEGLTNKISEKTNSLSTLVSELQSIREKSKHQLQSLDEAISLLKNKILSVDENLFELFETISCRVNDAVVPFDRHACSGCRTSIPASRHLKMRESVVTYIEYLHRIITEEVVNIERENENDAPSVFREDNWKMPNSGGGGITRVLENGSVFEKAGVNFSNVKGSLSEKLATRLNTMPSDFFATGVSVVIHPKNPFVPTAHCNYRYFEQYDSNGTLLKAWFGGGADLTPYFPYLEDIQHFHRTLKNACSKHENLSYDLYKQKCDDYFFLPHRNETRGVGGIFFDYLNDNLLKNFEFLKSVGNAFVKAYFPIVKKRNLEPYSSQEREFQLYRRGRYVEFNLLFDRGTLFGIETLGRTESILMSLPNQVHWIYDYQPKTEREKDIYKCLKPRDWLLETKL